MLIGNAVQDCRDVAATTAPTLGCDQTETRDVKAVEVKGEFRHGPMRLTRDRFTRVTNPTLAELLEQPDPCATDYIIEAMDDAGFTVLDLDTHHLLEKPEPSALEAFLAALQPEPHAAWVSHGRGLKAIFVGPHHRARAVAAALAAPNFFQAELIQHTRHPLGARSDMPGAACGPVRWGNGDPEQLFEFKLYGHVTEERRAEALAQLRMEMGQRYDHQHCPIDGAAQSTAKGCVLPLPSGIYCHRCASNGNRFRPNLKPGFYPYSAVLGTDATDLQRLVRDRVHWIHAQHELKHAYPNLGLELLREAYRLALEAKYPADPRIKAVFNEDLNFLRGDGFWIDSETMRPRQVDHDAAGGLPYCQFLTKNNKNEIVVKVDPVRRSRVRHAAPGGYKPVRPYRGLFVGDANACVPVSVDSETRFKVELLDEPMPEAEALARIQRAFPKLNPAYLKALLAGAICAARGEGRPPMICADGPSGSGKGETPRLAASFLSDDVIKIILGDSIEETNRQIGCALLEGRRFLLFDELGKVHGLAKRFGTILQLGSHLDWRPLYSPQIRTHLNAVFVFPSVSFPDWLQQSSEFVRRTRAVRLNWRVPEWSETSGGDTAGWRDRSSENARAANSLLTHVYALCTRHGFAWTRIADELGLTHLDAHDEAVEPEQLRRLYRAVRGEEPGRVAVEGPRFSSRGWVSLSDGPAAEIIEGLVDMESYRDMRSARKATKMNLEAQAWNDLLRIPDPPIKCSVRIHGQKWGLRFQSTNCLRGQELVNEELPEMPEAHAEWDVLGQDDPPALSQDEPFVPESEEAELESRCRAILQEGGYRCAAS